MAANATIIWRVFSSGSDTLCGGGYDPSIGGGTDYSKQNSAQYNTSTATTSAASATIAWTSASSDMVGNVIQITAGTNATAGFYTVISVSAGVSITVDRNCTTAAGSGITLYLGGALATIGKLNGVAVAGNRLGVKGSFSRGSNDTLTSSVGTATAPIVIEGYGTTLGDGYLGRTSNVKGLTTTNMPTITYSSTFSMNLGNFTVVKYLNVSGTFNGTLINNPIELSSCVVSNAGTTNARTTVPQGGGFVYDCDLTTTGTASTVAALLLSNANCSIVGCHIFANGGSSYCIFGSVPSSSITRNLLVGGNIGVNIGGLKWSVDGNTVVGCTTGIFVNSANPQQITNNMLTDGTTGVDFNSLAATAAMAGNYFRNNTTDIANAGSAYYQDGRNIHQSSGSAYVDYTSQSGGDYSLAATSQALNAIQPYATSPGCFQTKNSGGSANITIVNGANYILDC